MGMSWYVGVPLREHHEGPLHFAAWLERTWSGSDHRVIGLHVMGPGADSPYTVPDADRSKVQGEITDAVKSKMTSAGVSPAASVELVVGEPPEYALFEALDGREDIRALIVGRRSNRDDHRFVRLGKTTRRLLRSSDWPVVVVPPDLPADGPGSGPIVLATDLDEDCEGAAAFARQLSVATGRELVLAICVPHFQWGDVYVATLADERARIDEAERQKAEAALQRWAEGRGLAEHRQVVVQGDAVHELGLLAEREKASVLVCGTRKTSMLQRIFDISVSTELAGAAPCPVAVAASH